MRVEDFNYLLPDSAIAQEAIDPRDHSRLLDTRDLSDHLFVDLPYLLRPGDLVVVNDTRVRAARLKGHRQGTGGRIELLVLERRGDGAWEALAKPARRLRPGAVIELGDSTATIVERGEGGMVVLTFDCDDPEALIAEVGVVPLPPYFTGGLTDPGRYQTIFADLPGSAAAPTAGLHFTPETLAALGERGVAMATIDLHVSLDTFRPMTVEMVEDHVMHAEWCSVPESTAQAIGATRSAGGRVVAVGTTVVRALESHADGGGGVTAGYGPTRLFLRPGTGITVPDLLVTNFHLPGSTLLVLLEAFMGTGWRHAYQVALQRGYRFLSFGDAMVAARGGT
jgi:S-adenosylmethionine:tRNA ribosyltransferase-isomerase